MNKPLVVKNNSPESLIEMAVQKGVDMAQLQALMDLQERWEKKEAKKSFLNALSKFQTLAPEIKKNKTAKVNMKSGGTFSYTYADLGNITKQIKGALNECGLSYRWEFHDSGAKIKVTCLVSHADGHTETTWMEAGLDNSGAKNDIQQKGSTQTYLQRYTLIGALGLSTADEDTDGKGLKVTAKEIQKNNNASHQTIDVTYEDEDEINFQWEQTINETKSKIELTNLYLKNRKAVDGNEKVKAMFKKQEEKFKTVKPEKVEMP